MVDAWTKPHFNSWIRDTLHGGKSAVDYYKALSEHYGKQVVFTEVGYKSLDGANTDPGVFGGSRNQPISRSRSMLHGPLQGDGELWRAMARRLVPLELLLLRKSDDGAGRLVDGLHHAVEARQRHHHDALFESRRM